MKKNRFSLFKLLIKLILGVFALAVLVAAGLGWTAYYAREIEPNKISITNKNIAISGLPREFEGMRIVQISDLHGKRFSGNKLTEKVNALKPDILVITGDVLDGQFTDIRYIEQVLGPLQARFGKFFVYGNNEYRKQLSRIEMDAAYKKAGVTVLPNSNYRVSSEGGHIWLVGVEDPNTGRDRLDNALLGTDNAPKILLAHSPEIINEASDSKIDLVLAGHTHGGQITVPGLARHPDLKDKVNLLLVKANVILNKGLRYVGRYRNTLNDLDLWNDRLTRYSVRSVKLPRSELMFSFNMKPGFEKYNAGLYKVGNTIMYVNRGLGETWISLRLFSPPEITIITLVSTGK